MSKNLDERYREHEGQYELPLEDVPESNGTAFAIALTAVVLIIGVMFLTLAYAQEHKPEHMPLHKEFYSQWQTKHGGSCCNNKDCQPAEIRYQDGELQVKSHWSGNWLTVSPDVIDREAVPPDGRNHACILPPYSDSTYGTSLKEREWVRCFAYGTGI